MEMNGNNEKIEHSERYILVAVATGNEEKAWASLDELADLLDTDRKSVV